jgi:hypothetical protein
MNKAKAAVDSFLAKDGRHDTTVHESIKPAVQHEEVVLTQRDEAQTALDREVHQDHYHTSVQPIQDREVLPEQHSFTTAEVEHRHIKHGNEDHVKQRLAAEAAQFKDTKHVGEIQHTATVTPTVAAEHIHHHVHESIQPVVQKETIQPSVVHTTIPVHEIHQNEPKHHTVTQLPAVNMSEFRTQGGHLSGREERTDAFTGEPKAVGGTLGGAGASGTTSLTDNDAAHGRTGTTGTTGRAGTTTGTTTGTTGTTGTTSTTGRTGARDSDLYDKSPSSTKRTTDAAAATDSAATKTQSGGSTTSKKPGFMDKLNPLKDSNADGKAGIMT